MLTLLAVTVGLPAPAALVAFQESSGIAPGKSPGVQTPDSVAQPDIGVPELVIAGKVVLRLRARAGGLSARERAFSLRQRLGPILTLPDLVGEDVTVQQQRPGQTAYIYVRDRLLITVDRNLALANETSIEGLASQWARNLRVALPQVNVTIRMSGNIPLGRDPMLVPKAMKGKATSDPPIDQPR